MNVRLPANSVISELVARSLVVPGPQSSLMQNSAPGHNQGPKERLSNISTLG